MTSNETYIHQQQARNRQIQKPKKQIKIHINDVFLDFRKLNQAFTQSLVPLVSPLATSISNFCAICCNSNAEKFLTCRTEARLSTKNLLTVSQTCAYNPSPAKSHKIIIIPTRLIAQIFRLGNSKDPSPQLVIQAGATRRKKEKPIERQTHTRGV
jgi:hypothetical protein